MLLITKTGKIVLQSSELDEITFPVFMFVFALYFIGTLLFKKVWRKGWEKKDKERDSPIRAVVYKKEV